MKTIFKAFWLIIAVLALNACKKNKDELAPIPVPEKNKTVFFSDQNSSFYALNALTGTGLWKYATNSGGYYLNLYASPVVTDKVSVFTDFETATVYCVDNNTGTLVWSKDNQQMSWLVSPLIIDDVVYISANAKIRGFNLADGNMVKEINIPNDNWANTLNYSKGTFIVGACGGHLAGISMDGTVQWQYESNASCYHSSPAIAEGVLYILSAGGKISALNIANGTEVWSRMIDNYTSDGSLLYYKNMLFTTGGYVNDDKLYAFDAANGDLKHTYLLPAGQTTYWTYAPAVKGDNIYFRSPEGSLMAYNIDNENMLWQKIFPVSSGRMQQNRVTLDGRVLTFSQLSSIVAANGFIYFPVEKIMYAADMDGIVKWQVTAEDYISTPAVLSDKNIVYRAGTAGVVIK